MNQTDKFMKKIEKKERIAEKINDYEKAYDDIMKIICNLCPECTAECPFKRKVWDFVKGVAEYE